MKRSEAETATVYKMKTSKIDCLSEASLPTCSYLKQLAVMPVCAYVGARSNTFALELLVCVAHCFKRPSKKTVALNIQVLAQIMAIHAKDASA
eukprot:15532-Heterococcus_DN1.PRE.5